LAPGPRRLRSERQAEDTPAKLAGAIAVRSTRNLFACWIAGGNMIESSSGLQALEGELSEGTTAALTSEMLSNREITLWSLDYKVNMR
jgi:hypothetical protein